MRSPDRRQRRRGPQAARGIRARSGFSRHENAYPNAAAQAKKKLEAIEKKLDEDKNIYWFHVRSLEDDRLLGFATIRWIEWTHGSGWVQLGIGGPQDWRKGIGTQVLDLLLEYAFNELNLYRLSAIIPEYNPGAQRLFEKAGFAQEVRRRQALNRDGRRWRIGCIDTEAIIHTP